MSVGDAEACGWTKERWKSWPGCEYMSKNTGRNVTIAIVVIVLLIALWGVSAYNSLVRLDESLNEKFSNVQADYQRRADLIPNLVAAVKSYTNYEGTVLTDITNARSAWTSASSQNQKIAAAGQMDSAIARLLVVAENYPNLKANENYLSLQDELAGTENRIKISREIFNAAVKDFNVRVRTFPSSLIASWFSFGIKQGFEAQPGTQNAPNVGDLLKK